MKREIHKLYQIRGFPGGSDSKESDCNAGDPGSIPGLRRCPWRREWQPTPVFLPGEFHGQRSLVGYSPWNHKELDTTEELTHTHTHTHTHTNYQYSQCDETVTESKYSVQIFTSH